MRFLIESALKAPPTPDVLALIPAETARGLELDAQGVRQWLLVAADQSKAWQLLTAESMAAAQAIVATFPLHSYVDVNIIAIAGE